MLPKRARIKKHTELLGVLRNGHKLRGRFFVFNVTKTNQPSRLGITIPSKTIKGAVERNRLKRFVLAEADQFFRGSSPGYDIAISLKSPASLEDIKNDLKKLFEDLKNKKT